jgi:hypothetical protein
VITSEIPLLANGKVDRRALATAAAHGRPSPRPNEQGTV